MGIAIKLLGKCPDCDSPKIKDVIEDRVYIKDGKKIVIPKVPHEKCFACGERFFGPESYEVIEPYQEKYRFKKRKAVI